MTWVLSSAHVVLKAGSTGLPAVPGKSSGKTAPGWHPVLKIKWLYYACLFCGSDYFGNWFCVTAGAPSRDFWTVLENDFKSLLPVFIERGTNYKF